MGVQFRVRRLHRPGIRRTRFAIDGIATRQGLDEVRRAEVAAPTARSGHGALKRTRWVLQKNPCKLSGRVREKLDKLVASNWRLFRAYLLKDALAGILDSRHSGLARYKLREWVAWASRSRLQPFRRVAATVNRFTESILADVETRLSDDRTEALNGKTRTLTRRAYGFSASAFIAPLKLCCAGVVLGPVRLPLGYTH